jgi:putative transposase
VQVDHCLIDVFVHPPGGGPPVRPWLTAIIDTATRMVIGIHIGFAPPSYASLQRCIVHAIWPKDLSDFPDIMNEWPACGVFDLCLADNGLEFHSDSLRETEAALDFEVMNLPIRSPWLKGIIERLFRTFNTRVFDFADGKVLQRQKNLEPYNAARHATWTLDRLCYEIVKFIVDEHHLQTHPRIKAAPLHRWRELTAIKAVRLPPNPDFIIPMTGELWRKKIGAKGVQISGLTYLDRELFSEIRAARGGRDQIWDFRRDPFDLGQIHLQYKGAWRHIPCTTPQVAVGVTRFQHRMHAAMARRLAGNGQAVTERDLLEARALVAAQAQDLKGADDMSGPARNLARYDDHGVFVTALSGHDDPLRAVAGATQTDAKSTGDARPAARSHDAPTSNEGMEDWMDKWTDG